VLNTVAIAFFSISLQLGVGLAVALTLHANFRYRALVRTVMLLPLRVPTIVAGAVMLLIFSRSGYLNAVVFALADAVHALLGIEWRFVPLSWTVAGGCLGGGRGYGRSPLVTLSSGGLSRRRGQRAADVD
jgi:ABC-type sugar transport system permease subunit